MPRPFAPEFDEPVQRRVAEQRTDPGRTYEQAQEVIEAQADARREAYRDQAYRELWAGELNHAIDELIRQNPIDVRNISLHALFPSTFVEFEPSNRDFMLLIGAVIDGRVDELVMAGE